MPQLMKYTPDEIARGRKLLETWNPDRINQEYYKGEITLREKREMTKTLGQLRQAAVADGGVTGQKEIDVYLKGIADSYGKIFNKQTGDISLYHGLMTALEVLKYTDIPGDVVERKLLEFGSPPTMARAANWMIWIPANFMSFGTMLAPFTKGAGAAIRGVKAGKASIDDVLKFIAKQSDDVGKTGAKLLKEEGKLAATLDAGLGKKVGEAVVKGEAKGGTVASQAATVASRDADVFADDLAKAFGVNVDEVHQMIQKPIDLENATAKTLFNTYREKAQEQIRKGVSHELTELQQVGAVSYDDLVERLRGTGATAAQIKESIYLTNQITKGMDDLIEKSLPHIDDIAAGNRPDIIAQYKAHIQALTHTNPATLGAVGELGRGMEILKTVQPELAGMRAWNNVIDSLGADSIMDGTDAMIAKTMQRMSLLGKEQKAKFLTEAAGAKEPSKLHGWYKSLLFLSPSTHIVNLVGTAQGVTGKLMEHTGSALLPFNNGAPSARAAMAAWAGTFDTYSHLPTLLRKARGETAEKLTKAELAGGAPMDAIVRNGPLRWLGIEDEAMSAGIENGFIKSQLIDDAMARGVPTADLGEFVNKQLLDPKVYEAMAEKVKPMVDEAVFHGALSETSEKVVGAIRNSKLDYYMPVLKTPINLLKMERDWTPGLQLFSKKIWADFEAGGAQEAAARSRMTLSWMMANSLWSASKAGIITGGGPQDPEANKIWRQHNQPYTINGYSYRQWEPVASLIGVYADMAHMSADMPEETARSMAGALQVSMYRMVENNYWLRIMDGVTGVVKDVKNSKGFEDNVQAIGKLVLSPAITVASGGPVGTRVREYFDPEIKDTGTDLAGLYDHFKSKVPGWSKTVRPRLNLDGKPEVMPPSLGGREMNFAFSGIRYKENISEVAEILTKHDLIVDDEWGTFGGRAEFRPGRIPRTDRDIGISLSEDEQHDWKKMSLGTLRNPDGLTWVEAIKKLDADPAFQSSNRIDKQREVNLLRAEFREMGQDELTAASPKIAARVKQAEIKTEAFRAQGDQAEPMPKDTDPPLPTFHEVEFEPVTEVPQ
jgi:hypothetical protein